MNIHRFFAVAVLLLAGCNTIPQTAPSPLMSETMRDAQGRLKMMSAWTDTGSCVAEIVYMPDAPPRIYVLHIALGHVKNLGALQLNYAMKKKLTEADLVDDFRAAITKHCLQFIIGGFV